MLKPDLPELPKRMQSLPVQDGYPVPWFVAKVEERYDFRVVDPKKFAPAIKQGLCWICGQPLGPQLAFTIGPMCAINRIVSEPPAHKLCAEWAVKACPFLNQSLTQRRETKLPDQIVDAPGNHNRRQPGVACVWLSRSYRILNVDDGILFNFFDPISVHWYREGRAATHDEVLHAIEEGYELLLGSADSSDEQELNVLKRNLAKVMKLIPQGGNYEQT